MCCQKALYKGSIGAEANGERTTAGKLQAGDRDFTFGRLSKKDLKRLVRKGESETVELSANPVWHEAMAERKERMVVTAKFLSNKEIKKSATCPKVAVVGSHESLSQQVLNGSSRES